MLNSNVGSRKQIKQERNWVLGKGTGEGFYEKKWIKVKTQKERMQGPVVIWGDDIWGQR